MYYRWHPLFGLSLPVRKRRRTRDGEQVLCQVPDGTLCSIPDWMFRPECAQFSFGAPLISVEALCELQRLVVASQTQSASSKALLKSSGKEEGNEAIGKATHSADESTASGCTRDVPGDKHKELALTLMEILINAARENELLPRAQGGDDEPAEAHR